MHSFGKKKKKNKVRKLLGKGIFSLQERKPRNKTKCDMEIGE